MVVITSAEVLSLIESRALRHFPQSNGGSPPLAVIASSYTVTKLAGLISKKFSSSRPLLGPLCWVYSGLDTKPP